MRRSTNTWFALALALGTALALMLVLTVPRSPTGGPKASFDPSNLRAVLEARRQLDQTLWAPEQLALAHEDTFARLWDKLRSNANYREVLDEFPFESIELGSPRQVESDEHGILTHEIKLGSAVHSADVFGRMVDRWQQLGYQLRQSEWHHEEFRQDAQGRHESIIAVSLHLASRFGTQRIQIAGPLTVTWSGQAIDGFPVPAMIDARQLTIKTRAGRPAFRSAFTVPLEAVQSEATYNDILAGDVDDDGDVDLAYPRTNVLLRNDGTGVFQHGELCRLPRSGICEGLLVDFNADTKLDLLCGAIDEEGTGRAIYLYESYAENGFVGEPRRLTESGLGLVSPDSMTVGDIDLDGDLDVYVTQYHAPYRDGRMPSPYYDANDGLPSYLLLNDGMGRLRDVTEQRGLAEKRFRRTYRSSLVDLDGDGDLDLLVTSDFSGVDLYRNDGRGFFHDVTGRWLSERTLFGMSHVIADLDNDARLDIYATGMASTTARRLESLGLSRDDFPENRQWRTKLAHGNRLYFGGEGPRFQETARSADVARAGWSWGCAALDVENDGDLDLYVANGHLSGQSAADYCTRFWCHDIYQGHQEVPGFVDLVKRNSLQLGVTVSWNGYEKNRLYLNRSAFGFSSAAFLMDVAVEQDSRSVLAEDVNADGQLDLLVGYADRNQQPPKYALNGFLNTWEEPGHWIGVRPSGVPGSNVVGATVSVHTASGVRVATAITGDSFASQHSTVMHFGLGQTQAVRQIEVRWVGGKVTRLPNPAIDQYHVIGLD